MSDSNSKKEQIKKESSRIMDMLHRGDDIENEVFPHGIDKQSFHYIKETLNQLQEEMKHKNEQISVMIDAVSGGLKCSRDDEDYSFSYVSEEAAMLFGYTVEEYIQVTGGTAKGAVYPEDLPRVLDSLALDFASGPDYAQKYRVRCKDGSLKWILDRGRKMTDSNGETVINSLYLDITKAEQDEQKYLQQRELLSSIYNTVPCGILRLERKNGVFNLMSINPAASTLLGYNGKDISCKDWSSGIADTVIDEDYNVIWNSYDTLYMVGDRHDIDYRVRWTDGSIHLLHGSNHLISADSESQVFQRIFVDITESKTLQDAYEAARKGNAAKSEFLSQMSHDMRTPMNAIMGLNSLAMQSNDLVEIKDYLDKIQLSSQLLLNLINDVLDTEKIESHTLQLNFTPYNASEFIELMNVFLKPLCEAKQISYSVRHYGNIDAAVLVDKTRLNQIITNLLSNAVKFTPDGGQVTLEIYTPEETENSLTCQFTIKDTGIGMTEEYLKHIGEPFSREARKGYEQITGTGLGLAITKGLVEALDGKLFISSKINRGSCFTVELTLEKCQPHIIKKPVTADVPLTGKRILLCEDNDINAQIATKLLTLKEIKVERAVNGAEGLSMFENSPFYYYDAILMDIRMPEMDGLTASRRIRFMGRPDAGTIPIIAMTANAFEHDRHESQKAGMDAHLAKPVSPELLYQTLMELCAPGGAI